jgi:outer membrane protein assembly factor BamA
VLAWLFGIILLAGNSEADFQEKSDTKNDSTSQRADTVDRRMLQVDRILIIGNKVTRNRIITRELSLNPGDTISATRLAGVLQWDKNKLYNLRLFNTVSVRALEMTSNHFDILVEVTERWYIFPVPIFELSDRNFNEWWNNYNHDLDRINYGIRLYKNNFRGRNETVRLTAQFGYVRKFDLQYKIPNLDRKQKHGLTFNFDYGTPRNIPYMTLDHKLVFLESDKVVRTTFGASVGYSYRKNFFETHQIGFGYRNSHVVDTVLQLNPIYYNGGKTTQRFYTLSYTFNSEHRDVVLYPLKGYQFAIYIAKSGLLPDDDVNQFEINASYARHWATGKGFFLSNFTSALWSNPTTQPYNVFNALGYRNQLVRGFENYVVEGPQFALNKTTFKKKLFGRAWTLDYMPIEQFRHFPLAIYIKTFADLGYVSNYPYYDEKSLNQKFSNRLLTGAGAGLDVVTAYDLVFRIEYTFTTQKPEGSFFLNLRKEF